jgi:hypothetical protein
MKQTKRYLIITTLLLLVISIGMAGCSRNKTQEVKHNFDMAPLSEMPEYVQQAPVTVHEAYQFATANPEITSQIPCYCGCGAMGHTSSYACFVADDTEGEIVFDEHAMGCSICVDIAQDTMRLLDEGKSVDEIFSFVDNAYSRFGPPTSLEQPATSIHQ